MVLKLSKAEVSDVKRIADIHLAAFDSNPLLHVQFPTAESLKALASVLANDSLHTIQAGEDSGKVVLVVRDSVENDEIISFAKWDLPGIGKATTAEPEVIWPEDCKKEYLDEYYEKAEAAKKRVVGLQDCYRLTFVGTDPKFQGRGAGTMLTSWGLERAEQSKTIVYLESTIDASSLYRRLGFISMDGLSMNLPGHARDGGPNFYQEVGMIRTWEEDDGMDRWDSSLSIISLGEDYQAGMKPQHVIQAVYDRIESYGAIQPSLWIYLRPISEVMTDANRLSDASFSPDSMPLWGIPFSVKDSIDIANVPTTNGCPALATTPTTSATVVQKCIDAGGLFIGKTNMEQLATGMTGCRSPYGTLHSTFNERYSVGGSSSGCAVSVSAGLVSFSLGSDTAGSIRVPAMFNGIVGFKPTKGSVSAKGVAPACKHQDIVSFLTQNVEDASTVWQVCKGYDEADAFARYPPDIPKSLSRPILADKQPAVWLRTPPTSVLDACNTAYRKIFEKTIDHLEHAWKEFDVELKPRRGFVDWEPFAIANDLLYNGTFVLERLTTLPEGWFAKNKNLLHPVTRQVFENAISRQSSAIEVFHDLHKQEECKRIVERVFSTDNENELLAQHDASILLVPTTPFHPTIREVEASPIDTNSRLGTFTHFANVLDLCAIAIPCGTYAVERTGRDRDQTEERLPFGITLLALAWQEQELLRAAKIVQTILQDTELDLDEALEGWK